MADYDTIAALRAEAAEVRGNEARSPEMRAILAEELYPALDAAGFEATTEDLRWWGRWRARREPAPAAAARGEIVLKNTSGAAHSFAAGELVLEHGTTGARYRNLAAAELPEGSAGSPRWLKVAVEAEEPGEGSTAAPDTVDTLTTPIAGVTVTNPAALLGVDAEDDASFRVALKNADPLSVAVRQARRADATLIGATRAVMVGDELRVASPSGGDLAAGDLALLPEAVGEPSASAANATLVAIAVSYALEVVDVEAPADPTLEASIESGLAAYLATLPITGATVHADALDTVIRAALGMTTSTLLRRGSGPSYATRPLALVGGGSALVSLSVTVPAADVALAPGAVPVLGAVTPTITRV